MSCRDRVDVGLALARARLVRRRSARDCAAMSATTKCRRCQKPITWAVTELGKPMPVDPYAYDDGNVQLLPDPRGPGQIAHVMSKAELADPPPGPRYKAHFATCGRS